MMKKLGIVAAMAAVMLACLSCNFVQVSGKFGGKYLKGTGDIETRTYPVDEFSKLVCNLPAELCITEGEPSLEISTYTNIHDAISVVNNGGELTIKGKDDVNFKDIDAKVKLSCPDLGCIVVNGSVDLKVDDEALADDLKVVINGALNWETDKLTGNAAKIEINGAGNCELEGIDLQELTLTLNGAGNCELSGKAVKARVELNGAGNVDVEGLKAEDLDTNIHGFGKINRK